MMLSKFSEIFGAGGYFVLSTAVGLAHNLNATLVDTDDINKLKKHIFVQ